MKEVMSLQMNSFVPLNRRPANRDVNMNLNLNIVGSAYGPRYSNGAYAYGVY